MSTIGANTTICDECGGPVKRYGYGCRKCTCCNKIFTVNYSDLDTLNKANNLRHDNAFMEAGKLYKEILKEDPNFVEANWGALLCHFGVEYVQDNGIDKPTIHRPLNNYKINENIYAINLLNNVEGLDKEYYLDKIDELEELRSKIQQQTKDRKYDVFISCKITENGDDSKKTDEFKWAEFIYTKLSNIGLNVFFSPVSLAATNGAYEPIIYSALQSSKFLIVFAETPEHLNSKWVQNEWSRFIELRKNNSDKQYKLVLDSKKVSQKDIDEDILDVSYIDHNDKRWAESLVTAVKECFKDIDEYQNVDFGIDTIDINEIQKPIDKILHPVIIKKRHFDEVEIQNPFDVKFTDLKKDYSIDENVETCKKITLNRIKEGKWKYANASLKEYLDFAGDVEYDYGIYLLKLYIDNQVKDLDEFFETKANEFTDFKLFEKILKALPDVKTEDVLKPVSNYISNSIQTSQENNAIEFYKLVIGIQCDIIDKLNIKVMSCARHLFNNIPLLMNYIDLASPYVASLDINKYVEFLNGIARDLCKSSNFEEAQILISKVFDADIQNSTALLTQLLIKSQAEDLDVLLKKVEENNEFLDISNIIERLNDSVVNNIIGRIKIRINELIGVDKFEIASSWINILIDQDFEDRNGYFKGIFDKCINKPLSYKVFYPIMDTFDEEDREYFIKKSLSFVKRLLNAKFFEQAKNICDKLEEFAGTECDIYRYKIYAEIGANDFTYTNIYKLQDLSLVEKMLTLQETQYRRDKIVDDLVKNLTVYLSGTDVVDENVFVVFDKLLTYSKKDYSLSIIVLNFADECLKRRMFDKAQWYYRKVVIIDDTNDEAFWGIILSKLQCVNNDEVIKTKVPITSFDEYEKIINIVLNNSEKFSKYDTIALNQKEMLSQKKHIGNKKGIIIISSIGAICLVILIALLIVFLV